MWAKASNDCSTPTKEGLLSIEQLRERMPLLRQRQQSLRAELQAIADQSNDQFAFLRLAKTLKHSSPACAAPLKRLLSLSASASYGSWLKKFLWGMTPSPFATASPSLQGPRKMMASSHGQTQITFCVRGESSVLLSNVYLHYVLDLWFERVVKPRLLRVGLIGAISDDFVLCFQFRSDALRA